MSKLVSTFVLVWIIILAACTPVPIATPGPTATRTPSPLTPAPHDNVGPTVTPIPFKQIIDLSPDTPIEDEATIILRKSNGDFWKILVTPEQIQDRQLSPQLSQQLGLTAADEIIDIAPPASMMGHRPPANPTD